MSHVCKGMSTFNMFLGNLSLMWSHHLEMFPKGEIGSRNLMCMF